MHDDETARALVQYDRDDRPDVLSVSISGADGAVLTASTLTVAPPDDVGDLERSLPDALERIGWRLLGADPSAEGSADLDASADREGRLASAELSYCVAPV